MLDLVKKPNYLQQVVEEYGWARKRAMWILLSDFDLPDVPRLTWKELQYLTLGIHQLKQSRSFTYEHLNQSGLFSLYVKRKYSSVVQLQLRLRHTSSKVYNIWIKRGVGHNTNIESY
ncbi:DDE Tnp4 domain-containing protein [Trichonephila clavipes]|nr:DDE Tnp4 domain-containing protein [Trichonephila clavipes]